MLANFAPLCEPNMKILSKVYNIFANILKIVLLLSGTNILVKRRKNTGIKSILKK
jgi:hypothetical protein